MTDATEHDSTTGDAPARPQFPHRPTEVWARHDERARLRREVEALQQHGVYYLRHDVLAVIGDDHG